MSNCFDINDAALEIALRCEFKFLRALGELWGRLLDQCNYRAVEIVEEIAESEKTRLDPTLPWPAVENGDRVEYKKPVDWG